MSHVLLVTDKSGFQWVLAEDDGTIDREETEAKELAERFNAAPSMLSIQKVEAIEWFTAHSFVVSEILGSIGPGSER